MIIVIQEKCAVFAWLLLTVFRNKGWLASQWHWDVSVLAILVCRGNWLVKKKGKRAHGLDERITNELLMLWKSTAKVKISSEAARIGHGYQQGDALKSSYKEKPQWSMTDCRQVTAKGGRDTGVTKAYQSARINNKIEIKNLRGRIKEKLPEMYKTWFTKKE